jgi:hypothetical protein
VDSRKSPATVWLIREPAEVFSTGEEPFEIEPGEATFPPLDCHTSYDAMVEYTDVHQSERLLESM